MKTIYYVDAENIGTALINSVVHKVVDGSILAIFYSDYTSKMYIGDLSELVERNVIVKYIRCFTGKNALDFQLISTLGYSLAKLGNDYQYIVVSNDYGYDSAVQYWKKFGYDVQRITVTKMSAEQSKTIRSYKARQLIKDLKKKGLSDGHAETVADIFNRYKDERLDLRMNHIRGAIFARYKHDCAQRIWAKSKNIIRKV